MLLFEEDVLKRSSKPNVLMVFFISCILVQPNITVQCSPTCMTWIASRRVYNLMFYIG